MAAASPTGGPQAAAGAGQSILTQVPVPCIGMSTDGMILEVNDVALGVLGGNVKETLGQSFVERFVAKADRSTVRSRLADASTGIPGNFFCKVLVQTSTGMKRIILQMGASRDAEQRVTGVAVIAQEMSHVRSMLHSTNFAVGAAAEASAPATELVVQGQPAPVQVQADIELERWISQSLAEILDKANAPIFAVDLQGVITEWNLFVHEASGVTREKAVGTELSRQLAQESQWTLLSALSAAQGPDSVATVELQFQRNRGDLLFRLGASPQLNQSGTAVGVLFVGHVFPSPSNSAVAAGEQNKLFNSNTSRQVKSMVVHELRSPLHGIIGLANALATDDSPLQKQLRMICSSAERVFELVTNIIDYWKFSEEDIEACAGDPCDVSTIIMETLARIETKKDKRGRPLRKESVTLENEVPANLPVVAGDGQLLGQMFYHLLGNAFKFTEKGQVKVRAAAADQGRCIEVSITDTGIGIEEQNLRRIFRVFEQEDSSESRAYEGLGIGLAVVQDILRIHGGGINVTSMKGEGSCFTARLPCHGAKDAAVAAAAAKRSPTVAGEAQATVVHRSKLPGASKKAIPINWLGPQALLPSVNRLSSSQSLGAPPSLSPPLKELSCASPGAAGEMKPFLPTWHPAQQPSGTPPTVQMLPPPPGDRTVILSVDDDHVNQEVMKSVLEPCGFRVVVCMSGNDCLQYIDSEAEELPHLILLDLMMPGINGFDVLKAQRRKYSIEQLPIIMVSAKNQASSVVKGLELGCNDWIHKPFDRQELIARVSTQLQLRKLFWEKGAFARPSMNSLPSMPGTGAASLASLPAPSEGAAVVTTDSSAVFVFIHCETFENRGLLSLFDSLELLSEKIGAYRTEIVGRCYVAVAKSEDKSHADKMLRLAMGIQTALNDANCSREAATRFNFKIGIHTATQSMHGITSKFHPRGLRHYPESSFFSSAVHFAKFLSERTTAPGQIFMSHATRRSLSNAVEVEIHDRGLEMVEGKKATVVTEAGAPLEYVCLIQHDEEESAYEPQGPPALQKDAFGGHPMMQQQQQQQQQQHMVPGAAVEEVKETVEVNTLREEKMQLQRRLQGIQGELQTAQGVVDTMKSELSRAHEQLAGTRAEIIGLRGRLQQNISLERAQVPVTAAVDAVAGASSPTDAYSQASLSFLQKQNVHLQVDLQHNEQLLRTAQSELQVKTISLQIAEREQSRLQDVVEHLELELNFQKAYLTSIARGGAGLPTADTTDPGAVPAQFPPVPCPSTSMSKLGGQAHGGAFAFGGQIPPAGMQMGPQVHQPPNPQLASSLPCWGSASAPAGAADLLGPAFNGQALGVGGFAPSANMMGTPQQATMRGVPAANCGGRR